MGKHKPSCQCPLHQGKDIAKIIMTDDLRQKAIRNLPIFEWMSVQKLCLKCRNLIHCDNQKPKFQRGRKKQFAATSNENEPQAPSQAESILDSQAGSITGPRVASIPGPQAEIFLGPSSDMESVHAENEREADDVMDYDIDGEQVVEIASQSSLKSTVLSQATTCESEVSDDFLLEDLNALLKQMHVLSLCARYKDAKTKTERYQILTSLPGRFNATEVSQEAGIHYCTALSAVNLRQEQGVFSAPAPRPGRKISEEVVALVTGWYTDTDNSRPSPLMNITIAGPRNSRLGRRHMLYNQTEAYALFKIAHPDSKIKKTKFLPFAPKEIVWPKHHPYHNFCVCTTHANFDFLYEAFGNTADMKTFMSSVVCNPVTEECAYGVCNECIKMNEVYVLLETLQDEQVTYKQWTRNDGTELKTIKVPVDDFSRLFQRSLVEFIQHDFIKNKQKNFIKYVKNEKLKEERAVLIVVDFAQNYSVIIQNSVQGHHWSGRQVTVHPFACTYYDPAVQSFKEKNYIVISNEMTHDATTFNSFKRKVICHLKTDLALFAPKHIYYVSDNCGGQYKCVKNFAHLMKHEEEFGITAEWLFSAPGHGKSDADRLSAVTKSTTKIHALKHGNYILNAKEMYDFCVSKLGNEKMKFLYITKEEVSAERDIFQQLYATARKIRRTQKFHHFVPQSNGEILLARVAGSPHYDSFNMMKNYSLLFDPDNIDAGDLMCFVEARSIQIGMFIEKDEEYADFQVMKIARTNFHLRWPAVSVFVRVPLTDILMKVDDPIREPAGRFFTYTDDQIGVMNDKFELWNDMRN